MKTFTLSILMTLVQLIAAQATAAVLPLDFILQKHALVAGTQIVSIEQDVQFTDGLKTYTVRETWLIEGDRNLKLSARGLGELRDLVNLNYIYNNKTRSFLNPQTKARSTKAVGADFFEKYLGIKSKDSTVGYLKELGVGSKVQLARANDKICFLIGDAENEKEALKAPHLWIDQTDFHLMRMRLPSGAVIDFKNYAVIAGSNYPKEKKLTYDEKVVSIKVSKIQQAKKASIREFYPDTLEMPSQIRLESLGTIGREIEDFYSRFR